jgi:UDPglucose 6-dehydrogenase
MKSLMKHPVVVDGRNLYEPEFMAKDGFHYYAVGRPVI